MRKITATFIIVIAFRENEFEKCMSFHIYIFVPLNGLLYYINWWKRVVARTTIVMNIEHRLIPEFSGFYHILDVTEHKNVLTDILLKFPKAVWIFLFLNLNSRKLDRFNYVVVVEPTIYYKIVKFPHRTFVARRIVGNA